MVFKVPQFIEVEDKIFGPLTFRQFVYVTGGVGTVFVFRIFFSWTFAVIFGLPFIGLGAALAFYKMNDQPFIRIMESAFYYYVVKNRLYLWKKEEKQKIDNVSSEERQAALVVPKIGESRLKDLAWSLDIREKMSQGIAADDAHTP
jgi:hypothetical protein